MPFRPRHPLPPMPLWLRLVGVGVCFAPLIVGLVALALGAKVDQDALGEFVFLLFLLLFIVLLLVVLLLIPPLCWALGWRPGALIGSGCLALIGLGFPLVGPDAGRQLGGLLLLHIPLLGLLAWEWKAARRHRQQQIDAESPSAAL